MSALYAVVRIADSDDEAEGFGPFVSIAAAEKFRIDYEEWVSAYAHVVVELRPVREALREIREMREEDAW